jgi:hypothetical protein
MLIQTSSPRPLLNAAESPQHVKVHTIRRTGISGGQVFFNFTTDFEHGDKMTVPLEPYEVFPIEGEPGFEALEYYLPFATIFGTDKAVYDEERLLRQLQPKPSTALVRKNDPNNKRTDTINQPLTKLRGTQLALLAASGFHVIAKTAHRVEGAIYAERLFNFTVLCPVTGGGIIRIVGSEFDVSNPTFDPKAPIPTKSWPNSELLNAFNRTHKPTSPEIEDRKRKRIAEAEANMRAAREREGSSDRPALPPKKDF